MISVYKTFVKLYVHSANIASE